MKYKNRKEILVNNSYSLTTLGKRFFNDSRFGISNYHFCIASSVNSVIWF